MTSLSPGLACRPERQWERREAAILLRACHHTLARPVPGFGWWERQIGAAAQEHRHAKEEDGRRDRNDCPNQSS